VVKTRQGAVRVKIMICSISSMEDVPVVTDNSRFSCQVATRAHNVIVRVMVHPGANTVSIELSRGCDIALLALFSGQYFDITGVLMAPRRLSRPTSYDTSGPSAESSADPDATVAGQMQKRVCSDGTISPFSSSSLSSVDGQFILLMR
jgi:hypothetical protein